MVYFTSDIHFGHKNVIKHNARPFSSVEEMDEAIISAWNKKVHANDTVYIVGDVTLDKDMAQYVTRLKGKKILIRGNHDIYCQKEINRDIFEQVTRMEEVILDGKRITLCHFPMIEWPGSRRMPEDRSYGYLVYGHIHNRVKPLYRRVLEAPNALNAGMDIHSFVPVCWEELIENNRIFRERALSLLDTLPEGESGIIAPDGTR